MSSSRVPRTAPQRHQRRAAVTALAAEQAGVVSRRQVYELGLGRAEVRANVAAGRWQRVGRHVVAVTTGELGTPALLRAAQLSGGPRAQLDGASSLIAAGLKGFTVTVHRVSVPRGARTFRDEMVDVRQTRRWCADDCVAVGVSRTRSEVAAVRGALWARTQREAALLLTMTVQQQIVPAERLAVELLRIRRAPRLRYLHQVVGDLVGGVQSLGELDFAEGCRARGFPEPDRQVVRRTPQGTYYLDVIWQEYRVRVEIDGIHHSWAQNVVQDALRHNELTMEGGVVLRLPVLGLRVAPDDFFGQIGRALAAAGCPLGPPWVA